MMTTEGRLREAADPAERHEDERSKGHSRRIRGHLLEEFPGRPTLSR
jgi:hypothetical protein